MVYSMTDRAGPWRTGLVHLVECGISAMAKIPDDGVDVVITDPPYSDRTHKGARTLKDKSKGKGVLVGFDAMSHELLNRFIMQTSRVCKRWLIMTFDVMFCESLDQLAKKYGLELIRVGAWIKPDAAPQFTGDRPAQGWEPVYILHRKGRKRWNGGGHHAVWMHNVVKGGRPTEKPRGLISDFIRAFSEPGELVCDPFAGSGVVGEVCVELDRRFIGFEIDPDASAMANDRIRRAQRQPLLIESMIAQGELEL